MPSCQYPGPYAPVLYNVMSSSFASSTANGQLDAANADVQWAKPKAVTGV